MAVAKRNLEEIGESLENMGMNNQPSLLNTKWQKAKDKNISKGGRKRKSYWTAEEKHTRTVWLHILTRKNSFS